MNLFARTAEFERLCLKFAQSNKGWKIDPETGKMVDTTAVPAASLSAPTPRYSIPAAKPAAPKAAPNMSVDPGMTANPRMTKDPRTSNSPAKPAPLQPGAHPGAPAHPGVAAPKAPAKAPSAPAKPTKGPAPWLTQYKAQEDAKDAAPTSSVDNAIKRTQELSSTFDTDAAAANQVARAKNLAGK